MSAELRELQMWLQRAMTAPPSNEGDDREAARVMTPSARLSARERVDIYHRSYWARLVEVIGDDFPAVKHAMGEEAFTALCHDYVARFPSTGPNLNAFSRRIPEVLRERSEGFLADLSRLEWAIVEVIHAKLSPPITLEAIQGIPQDCFADMGFEGGSALRVLELEYPANDYFQAFKEEREPEIPAPASSCTAVYRYDARVWRWDMTPAMATVLVRLLRGEALGTALGALQSEPEMLKEALEGLNGWFKEWVSRGFFAAVRVP